MPVVKMPNGDLVRFPDDMPKEEIRAKIASKFPELEAKAAPASKGSYTGTILPIKKNLDTGEMSLAVPGLLSGLFESGASAITATGRAMSGELPMVGPDGRTSPQAIAESANMATWVTPTSVAAGTGKGIARLAEQGMPLSEGQKVVQSAQNIGVQLPKAVASDSASIQQMGKIVSNVPIAGQPLRKASQAAISQLDDAALAAQKSLGSGDKAVAGHSLKDSLGSFAKVDEPKAVSLLYKQVDEMVKPGVATKLSETAKTAAALSAEKKAAALPEGNAISIIKEAVSREGMGYDDIKNLRTHVNELRNDPMLLKTQNINQRDLNKIYDSLTADLKTSIKNAGGPDAVKAWEKANERSAIFTRDKKELLKVLGDSDGENLASRVVAMASNNSRANLKTLALTKSKVSSESWNEVASAAIADMGRDAKGAFTPDRWETAWGKLSPSGKKLLFGDGELKQSLDDIAAVSSRFKQLNQYANPSGTGQMIIGSGYIPGAAFAPTTTITSLAGAYGMAKLLASPASARAVADYSKAYEMAIRVPGKGAQNQLSMKARKLALIVANDMGRPNDATSIFTRLSSPQKAAADNPDNNGVGNPEGQPQSDNPDQRFNDAYNQGRAF